MARTLKKNDYELPQIDEVVFVKSDMTVEWLCKFDGEDIIWIINKDVNGAT